MNDEIPLVDLRTQYLSIKSEIDAAIDAVIAESAFIGTAANRFVNAFEAEFGAYVGRAHCIACANGTDALEILLAAAGVGVGDEVLVPALTWIATAEAVTSCRAKPVFVDILPGLYSMDPVDAAAKVTSRTKAIIPVHLYGMPARMDEILALAERRGLFVLEDCAQAHGASLRDQQVGTFGHAATFSFFPSKNLGAWGDAGAMTTNDPALARRARMIAQHGQGARKHDHQIEGRNSRMDGLQASLLSVKLKRLPQWTEMRRRIAQRFRARLGILGLPFQVGPEGALSAYHLFVTEVPRRAEVQASMSVVGVSTAVQYPTPLPLMEAYRHQGHRPEDFPVASKVTGGLLSLPLYPELSAKQESAVMTALAGALARVGGPST